MLHTNLTEVEMTEAPMIEEDGFEIVTKEADKKWNKKAVFNTLKQVADWAFILFMIAHFALISFFGNVNMVSGRSMEHTLFDGERIMSINGTSRISHGDMVVSEPELMGETRIVKRVIAMEGDTLKFEDGAVFLNGELLDEPYVNGETTSMYDSEGVIPEGHVWIMGDNRGNSVDSRDIGFVPMDAIEGKVVLRYFPFAVYR